MTLRVYDRDSKFVDYETEEYELFTLVTHIVAPNQRTDVEVFTVKIKDNGFLTACRIDPSWKWDFEEITPDAESAKATHNKVINSFIGA